MQRARGWVRLVSQYVGKLCGIVYGVSATVSHRQAAVVVKTTSNGMKAERTVSGDIQESDCGLGQATRFHLDYVCQIWLNRRRQSAPRELVDATRKVLGNAEREGASSMGSVPPPFGGLLRRSRRE